MNGKTMFFIGLLGVSLFAISAVVGGIIIENYSVVGQYISETYAIDTKYGMVFRVFGYIPSGILIAIFCFNGSNFFYQSKLTKIGFYGLAISYGIAITIAGLFPCDSGCNKEFIDPTISQIIHNLAGLITYTLAPFSIIIIGIGLKKTQNSNYLSILALICGIISILFVTLLFSATNYNYSGIYQRIIETIFITWIIICAITIKNRKPAVSHA